MRTFSILFLAVAMGAGIQAMAQAVYKHVDKDGKVYYSDKPPAKDDPRTKKIDVDPKRNVIPPLANKGGEAGGDDQARIDRKIEAQNQLLSDLKAAQERLAAAKEALEAGKTPLEDEWMTVRRGTTKRGDPITSTIPNENYHERVANLERAVAKAEAELAKAETAYRRGTPN
jgi:hypothetical protein